MCLLIVRVQRSSPWQHASRSCLLPFYTIPIFPLLNRKYLYYIHDCTLLKLFTQNVSSNARLYSRMETMSSMSTIFRNNIVGNVSYIHLPTTFESIFITNSSQFTTEVCTKHSFKGEGDILRYCYHYYSQEMRFMTNVVSNIIQLQ